MTGPVVILACGALAVLLACLAVAVLALVEAWRGCRCERCREEEGRAA